MRIFSELKRLVNHLRPWPDCWALCGGVVASVYRDTPRYTGDIDVAIINHGQTPASTIAESVIRELGLEPNMGFVPDPRGGPDQKNALVCGRGTHDERFIGVDFLLPVFPWVEKGVHRAQANLIDYGFAQVPTLTIEDLMLAKLNALQCIEPRPQDSDDIRSMMRSGLPIDYPYITREARALAITVPEWFGQGTK